MKFYKVDLSDNDIDNIQCSLYFCNRKMDDLLWSINYKHDMRSSILETIHLNEVIIEYLDIIRNKDDSEE